jgi:SAM-dependent methyltransferase
MRDYWNWAADTNAAWYVDTTMSVDDPDMEEFFATGRRIVSEALDNAPVTPPERESAVEIGSGLGRVCLALADRFDHVTGVDVAPEMVRQAKELVPDPRIDFRVTEGDELPGVADASVDFVITFTVFQHIPDPAVIQRYVSEVGRVLKPGGVLVCQWNNCTSPWRWRLIRAWRIFLARTRIRPSAANCKNASWLGSVVPVPRMRQWLQQAGMEMVQVNGEGTLFCWAWSQRTS